MNISESPYGDQYYYDLDTVTQNNIIDTFVNNTRQTIVVQGLGFVGSAMVAALALAKNNQNQAIYNVIGVDLGDEKNYWKIARVNEAKAPIVSNDTQIDQAYIESKAQNNILATYSQYAYSKADVVVVDIHLDIKKSAIGNAQDYCFTYEGYKQAIYDVANNISEETLVVIETTVPPGTTQKVITPIFHECFQKRGLDPKKIYIAHSYERVMPGKNYLNSITNYYRVFSGINETSRQKAKQFFDTFINTKEYPLSELKSTTASEMSKVLENSYRAMNIAFMQEWTQFANTADVDLFEVLDAIKMRSTHNNIMSPGFGVGGYCLTKDSLLADWAYSELFESDQHLQTSLNAININDQMPLYTFELMQQYLKQLQGVNIAILGISYLNDVADTRYSPTEIFYDKCIDAQMNVYLHDPIVSYWEEKQITIDQDIKNLTSKNIEVVVLTVRHKEYLQMDTKYFMEIFPMCKVVIDTFNILDDQKAQELIKANVHTIGIGKGHWNTLKGNNTNE